MAIFTARGCVFAYHKPHQVACIKYVQLSLCQLELRKVAFRWRFLVAFFNWHDFIRIVRFKVWKSPADDLARGLSEGTPSITKIPRRCTHNHPLAPSSSANSVAAKTELKRKTPALFHSYFSCSAEIALHNKKILTRFNSLKSKGPWFVKYLPNYFQNTDCEHTLQKHPSV